MARLEANSLGMGNLPLVVLPHPVGTLLDQEARAVADSAIAEVLSAITAPCWGEARKGSEAPLRGL
jgi:hypothetical protein